MLEYSAGDGATSDTANWMRWLKCFVGLPSLQALEFGTFEGRSALWFLSTS